MVAKPWKASHFWTTSQGEEKRLSKDVKSVLENVIGRSLDTVHEKFVYSKGKEYICIYVIHVAKR